MTDRWERVGEIFDRVLQEPLDRRDAFLTEACGGDADLLNELRSLLASHDEAAGFLEPGQTPLQIPGGPLPDLAPMQGQLVGTWRIAKPIAEGGMGIVYLVEREDGEFRQRGALKFIRTGMATEEMIRRFRRERQILASLEHPNVARLLDGGTTAEGMPWLVMEYVEGVPLYAWCSERCPTLSQRLRLFLAICAAVEAAHRRLILHRDIKPGNVLVQGDGMPRLLDFGVGKFTSADGLDSTLDLQTVQLPLTPEYASPEQLRGQEVTTASDVYSLGVLLYELSTGARPYPTRAGGTHEMIRTVLEQEPPRPSTAVGTAARAASDPAAPPRADRRPTLPLPPGGGAALRRSLTGDLDNIILKAMAKEPARRYGSAEELAADVRRYLDGRPVHARPSTWSYRTSKFISRNRVAVTAGTVAILALLGGLGAALYQARVATRERTAAERRLHDVYEIANTLIFDVDDAIEPLSGSTPAREALAQKTAVFLDRLAAEGVQDTALVRRLADAYQRLGNVQGQVWASNVGRGEEAYRSFKKSLALREKLLVARPDDPGVLFYLSAISAKIMNYDLEHGRIDEAVAMAKRAVTCMQRVVEKEPTADHRMRLARVQYNQGLALVAAQKVEEGTTAMKAAVAVFAGLAAEDPSNPLHTRSMAQASTGIADALMTADGGTDSALAYLDRARAIFERLRKEAPNDADLPHRVAATHYGAARIALMRKNDARTALARATECRRILHDLTVADPGNEDKAISEAIAESFEGHVRAVLGETDRAEAILNRARARFEGWAKKDSSDTRFSEGYIEAYHGLGLVEMTRARAAQSRAAAAPHWAAAREWLTKARTDQQRLLAIQKQWTLSREETAAIEVAIADLEKSSQR